MKTRRLVAVITLLALMAGAFLAVGAYAADDSAEVMTYDEAAYTEYVENTMKELDRLYLEFCEACGNDTMQATEAKKEFLVLVRDLMQQMNQKFDGLDPKRAAALSSTETLVSVHALTMVVDILAATQLEQMTAHPYIN